MLAESVANQHTEGSRPFICWDCDEQQGGFSRGAHHLAAHNLIRCMQAQNEEELKSGDDLGKVETRLDSPTEHTLTLPPEPSKTTPRTQTPDILTTTGISWKWNPYLTPGRSMTDPGYSMDSTMRLYRSRPADASMSYGIEEQD